MKSFIFKVKRWVKVRRKIKKATEILEFSIKDKKIREKSKIAEELALEYIEDARKLFN